jgi:hypothetical protein
VTSARERTLAHLQRLVAAATVVSAGTTTASACKKQFVKEGDASPPEGGVTASTETDASTIAVTDPDAVAPSTADSAVFVETSGKDAGHWRQTTKPTGYAVVDPMPPPARCNPPYTVDKKGKKHTKPGCNNPGFD